MSTVPQDSGSSLATTEVIQFIADVRQRVAEVVVGQDIVVERLLIALFTGGHILLQGCPASPRPCSHPLCHVLST